MRCSIVAPNQYGGNRWRLECIFNHFKQRFIEIYLVIWKPGCYTTYFIVDSPYILLFSRLRHAFMLKSKSFPTCVRGISLSKFLEFRSFHALFSHIFRVYSAWVSLVINMFGAKTPFGASSTFGTGTCKYTTHFCRTCKFAKIE